MNASVFMYKQIQSLAASGSAAGSSPPPSVGRGGLADLMGPDPQEDAESSHARRSQHHGGATDEVLPSYDFQPIRPSAAASSAVSAGSPPATGAWGSLDTKPASSGGKVLPQAPQPPPQEQYQTPPQYAQYSQPSPPARVNPSPSAAQPPSVPQQLEDLSPYGAPTQSYPPNVRPPPPYMPPPSGPVPPAVRPNSGPGPSPSYNTGYKPQAGPGYSNLYGYRGSPSHRGNAGVKPPSPFTPAGGSSIGSGNYGHLPTAQVLPQAAPVSSGPSGSSGSKVPIDEVVEKVATMGFSRDQVRATVRRLTENFQNVDLNVALDKLMNDTDAQPPRGWYGR